MKENTRIIRALALSAAAFLCQAPLSAQTSSMVGATDMREAKIVLMDAHASGESPVCAVKSKDGKWSANYSPSEVSTANGSKVSNFDVHSLMPGTEYEYSISSGGKEVAKGTFKTFPDYLDRTPPPDFSFVVLGNQFTNEPAFDVPFRTNGGGYDILPAIVKSRASFAIWADNIDTARPADIGSRSGLAARYLHAFSQKALLPVLTSMPNFGVLGIKMYAKSNEDSSSKSGAYAKSVFDMFWANPESPVEGVSAYAFSYADADFFILDDCSSRRMLDYQKQKPEFLGREQLLWLENALQNSSAKFKFVIMNSPMANPVDTAGHFKMSKESDELFLFLSDKKIDGVVLISANKQYGEVTRMVRANAYPIYDITVPVLTGRPAKDTEELNYFRVPNSSVFQRAFTKFSIDGPENARTLTVSFISQDGSVLFSLPLKFADLQMQSVR